MVRRGKPPVVLAVAFAAFVAAAVAMPLIGSSPVDYGRALAGMSPDREILFYVRVPRVLLSLMVGGSLALAGVLFQALLRDALATPYTLGISAGASLGAVVALIAGWRAAASLPGVWAGAFVGAGAALLVVLAIATEGRRMSAFTLLLGGTTINSMAMAMILFLQNLSDFAQSFAIVRWLMGGIEPIEYQALGTLAAALVAPTAYVLARARDWNLLAVGEDWAAARGVSVGRVLAGGYVAGSVITGLVTAVTGPIGFVGLIVPHALRLRLGADHRLLMPCSLLFGATFLAVCDTVARTVLAPVEIPVGVITAMLGGPFFIWLLRSRGKRFWQ